MLAGDRPMVYQRVAGPPGLAREVKGSIPARIQLSAHQLGLQNLFSHCGGAFETTLKC